MTPLEKGCIGSIFWSVVFELLMCKSDFNLIFLLQSMTAEGKQSPKINSFLRFCHNRFSKAKNETSECPLNGSLCIKILRKIRPSEMETAIFIPSCKLGSCQPFFSAMSLPRSWIQNSFRRFTLGKGAFWVLSAFGAFSFPEEPFK